MASLRRACSESPTARPSSSPGASRPTAANDRDAPAERKRVRPALAGSWEAALHDTGLERLLLPLGDDRSDVDRSSISLLERAIGVIYRPKTERLSHYFHAWLAAQFDALVHIGRTTAVEPLQITPRWRAGEPSRDLPHRYLSSVSCSTR